MKFFISLLLFAISGMASAFIYHVSEERLDINWLYPGLFFTATAILVFLLYEIEFKILRLVYFCILMLLLYCILYWLTFFTFFFGFIVGIISAGVGAIFTCDLTNRFLRRITYDRTSMFLWGALAFILSDILMIDPIADLLLPLYKAQGGISNGFAAVFFFWQIFVGTKLVQAFESSSESRIRAATQNSELKTGV